MKLKKYDSAMIYPPEQAAAGQRRQPPENSLTIAVRVWLYAAGIIGALVALAMLALYIPLGHKMLLTWAVPAGFIAALILFAGLFFWRGIPLLETLLGFDLNGDGLVGEQPRREITLTVEHEGGRHVQRRIDLPLTEEQFPDFVRLSLKGETSLGAMAAVGIDRLAVEQCRAILFERELARWKKGGTNQGWELTRNGRQAFLSYQAQE